MIKLCIRKLLVPRQPYPRIAGPFGVSFCSQKPQDGPDEDPTPPPAGTPKKFKIVPREKGQKSPFRTIQHRLRQNLSEHASRVSKKAQDGQGNYTGSLSQMMKQFQALRELRAQKQEPERKDTDKKGTEGRKVKKTTKPPNDEDGNPSPNGSNWVTQAVIMAFMTIVLFGGDKAPESMTPVDYEAILAEIERNENPIKVTVSKSFYSSITISVQDSANKISKLQTNELGLVNFLEKLEQFNRDNVTVSFNFKILPVQRKQLSLRTLLAGAVAIFLWRYVRLRAKTAKSEGGGGMPGFMNNMMGMRKFEPIQPESIGTKFTDVAGMHEAKFEVTEFVDFLKNSGKYIEMGAKVPKGALLTGPPGTGKTLLAKACAGEAGVPFFTVSGSDFVEKYSGMGASRVRSLFDEAEKQAPSIIFIDEIDAIGKKRNSGPFANEERDNTLNQLLVRMDGFETKNKVIVMAATNRKDMLDPALLRPGRFDRSVEIGLPNIEERQEILKVHLAKVAFDKSFTIEEVAKRVAVLTPGFSGAELANTCNEAAILAARQNKNKISLDHFEKATERIVAGLEKRNMFSQEEKEMLAYYECGKAIVSWFTEGADPIIKISIIPHSKSSSGFSQNIKDETALHTKEELLAKAAYYLAGRSAEMHFKGYITTNGDNDLQRAKRIINMIVTKFGMSDSLRMIAFPDYDFVRKPYSEQVEEKIDAEIKKLTEECQAKASALIKEKEKEILLLREKLLEKETLTHKAIEELLGERPFSSNANYQEFLKDQNSDANQPRPRDTGPGVGVGAQ